MKIHGDQVTTVYSWFLEKKFSFSITTSTIWQFCCII